MRAANFDLQVNAGHGINYRNIALIHKIPHLTELNIGHSIVARAIFVGFETAVREMLALMQELPRMRILGIGVDMVEMRAHPAFARALRRTLSPSRLHRRARSIIASR